MPSECLLIGRFEKMHDCVTNAHWTPLIWLELKQNEGVVWDVLESISIKKRNARGHLIFFPTASQVWIEPVEIFICFVSSIFWAIFGHKPLRVHRWDVLESISIKKIMKDVTVFFSLLT